MTIATVQRGWDEAAAGPTMTVTPVAEPYPWVTMDLETTHGRPEDAQRRAYRSVFGRKDILRFKPETIGNRVHEAVEAWHEKRALIDECPVVIVSLKTPTELRVLHHLKVSEPEVVEGALVEGFSDERGMLVALRSLLDARCTEETVLSGHNLIGFDLPKLRRAYLAAGLRLPSCLAFSGQPVFDSMREWRRFSLEDRPYVALADILEALNMPAYKSLIDGSQVPDLVEAGEVDALVRYALLDAVAEAEVMLRMTGRAPDREAVGS